MVINNIFCEKYIERMAILIGIYNNVDWKCELYHEPTYGDVLVYNNLDTEIIIWLYNNILEPCKIVLSMATEEGIINMLGKGYSISLGINVDYERVIKTVLTKITNKAIELPTTSNINNAEVVLGMMIESMGSDIILMDRLKRVSKYLRTMITNMYPVYRYSIIVRPNSPLLKPNFPGYVLETKLQLNMFIYAKEDEDDIVEVYKRGNNLMLCRPRAIDRMLSRAMVIGKYKEFHVNESDGGTLDTLTDDGIDCLSRSEGLYFVHNIKSIFEPFYYKNDRTFNVVKTVYYGRALYMPNMGSTHDFLSWMYENVCPLMLYRLFHSDNDVFEAMLRCNPITTLVMPWISQVNRMYVYDRIHTHLDDNTIRSLITSTSDAFNAPPQFGTVFYLADGIFPPMP